MNLVNISTSDFNKQLFSLLDSNSTDSNNNCCLISNNILEEDHVTLECGHKFNYEQIFLEVKRQKIIHNSLEVTKLKNDEIKCPYCRKIQKGLLIHNEKFPKINKVNWPECYQLLPNQCQYIFLSGKKKGNMCSKKCLNEYCKSHKRIIDKRKLKKQKKEEEKKNKILIKQQILNKKEKNNDINSPKDPILLCIDKMIQELKKNKQNKTNEIMLTCKYTYKRGVKKGTFCKCKKIYKDGFCKTHFKNMFKNKEKIKTITI